MDVLYLLEIGTLVSIIAAIFAAGAWGQCILKYLKLKSNLGENLCLTGVIVLLVVTILVLGLMPASPSVKLIVLGVILTLFSLSLVGLNRLDKKQMEKKHGVLVEAHSFKLAIWTILSLWLMIGSLLFALHLRDCKIEEQRESSLPMVIMEFEKVREEVQPEIGYNEFGEIVYLPDITYDDVYWSVLFYDITNDTTIRGRDYSEEFPYQVGDTVTVYRHRIQD